MSFNRVEQYKIRKEKDWLVSTLVAMDPFVELAIENTVAGTPSFTWDDVPEKVVFQKGTGSRIAATLRELNIQPARLPVWCMYDHVPYKYTLTIKSGNDLTEWIGAIVDHRTEKALERGDLRWQHFSTIGFWDQNNRYVMVSSPDEHQSFWRDNIEYAEKYTDDCFLIHIKSRPQA